MILNIYSPLNVVVTLIFVLFPAAVEALDTEQSNLVEINAPWARASIGTIRPSAAYFSLHNTGKISVLIDSVTSNMADNSTIHQTTVNADGIGKMRLVKQLRIEPGESFEFKPGSYHIMLSELKKPLIRGKSISLTLIFGDTSEKTFEVPILSIGARNSGDK